MTRTTLAALCALAVAAPSVAEASCMCWMRPPPPTDNNLADDPKNPATSVFLLRAGTRTVLTVEPVYDGPLTELSMIVPIPSVITREDVRTISGHHFRRVDRRSAPRAQHTWDACPADGRRGLRRRSRGRGGGGMLGALGYSGGELGVEVEESWDVDEYDVSLLNAAQSSGLIEFLRQRGLELPDRAAPLLRSYIESGHRFALIEVDPSRATEVGGQMVLDPIQLHYDSEELRVPVRLGTLNSPGEQELLLYVLSRDGRYEVANREALVAPTEVALREAWEGGFGGFYAGLMDELFRQHPGATLTEFARPVGSGGWGNDRLTARSVWWFGLDRHVERNDAGHPRWQDFSRWTLTRIRHRYGADLDDDLVLRPAEPLRPRRTRRRTTNNFRVRFDVNHAGEQCPPWAERNRLAQQWATSDALWSEGEPPWPGDALAVEVFGIAPGSERPVIAQAPEPEPEPAPAPSIVQEASPTAVTPVEASACSVRPGSRDRVALWGLLAAVFVWAVRKRRSFDAPT